MKTEVLIIGENDKKILVNAISKVNELRKWKISVSFRDDDIAEISTETREQILLIGILMGRSGY